ncbi:MAG: site-2 protease family protein [Clostridia bacterium]|nr:site-2 protease family protein [Clostridia bacterium]
MIKELITAVREANIYSLIAILITSAVLFLICMPSHEFAHAYAAYKLGDNTAKYQGRLTLNPLKHLDIWGMLMILVIGVGYAKPVPVNMLNFKNRKRDMALVAFAGPMMNLLFGVVFVFLNVLTVFIFSKLNVFTELSFNIFNILIYIFSTIANISISLAIFNLIPIPPFDGSRILGYFLPDRIYYKIMQYEHIIFIVVLVALWFGFLDGPLSIMIGKITGALYWLMSLPFGGF